MSPKSIKLAQLNQMTANGAEVKRQPREVIVGGLMEMMERLGPRDDSAIIDAIEKLTEAVSAQEKTDVRVEPINLKPLIAMLAPRKYRFEIERDNRGKLSAIDATPGEPIDD